MPVPDSGEAAVDDALKVVRTGDSVTIIGRLDRRTAEALSLDLRAVAKRHRLRLGPLEVLPDDPPAARTGGSPGSTE